MWMDREGESATISAISFRIGTIFGLGVVPMVDVEPRADRKYETCLRASGSVLECRNRGWPVV